MPGSICSPVNCCCVSAAQPTVTLSRRPNNVNGVDDGYRGGPAESGLASVTMTATNAITDFQDAYVRKTIDTLNDLPNVLWIVSEEAPMKSTWWNNHLISLVRAYERGKPYQHPIGYATLESPADSILYNSDADWVAPWAWISPANSCGTAFPACKVNINDSDHSYFGMWNDTPQKNRNYAWENFTDGQSSAVHGPVPGLLPARESEPVPFSGQRHRQQAGPALGEFPEQPGISPAIFTQAQPGQCHSQEFSLFDEILPSADPARRRGIPGLCSRRRRIYHGSFCYVQRAEAGGRMV